MSRLWYAVWAGLVLFSFVAGLTADPPDLVSSKRVLSAQDVPLPAAFPVRVPGSLDPKVNARYVILIDADSFYPLFKQEAYTKVPIASTTKMMTALLALERFGLDEEITITREAALQIGSTTGLLPGERITVHALLKALLIQSGNDAAYALAQHSGSVEQFVLLMNERARSLGMRSTTFRDPAGLDDEGRSTAFDLSILAAALIKRSEITSITEMPEGTITSADGRQSHQLTNSNRLVTEELYFPGILGLKTGFTPGAGHTLVGAASREGRTLISIVLSTHEDSKEASARESYKLLQWGFDRHRWVFFSAPSGFVQ